MRKRVENNDATQDISASQLVPEQQKLTYPVVNKNDASMWMSQPVSADDFMQQPAKKPIAPKSNNWVVAVSAAVVVAAIAGGVWYGVLRDKPKQNTPAATASGSATPAPAQPAVAAATADAAVAQATADAAVAPAETPGVLNVDAISAADPAAKKAPTKKRPATKKKMPPKKKTATAPKKK